MKADFNAETLSARRPAQFAMSFASMTPVAPRSPVGLYVHIPFCQTKCSYCAFNTYTGMEHLIEPYLAALTDEMRHVAARSAFLPVRTLYFGGGTPSLLLPAQVDQVIAAAQTGFDLALGGEITMEVNPGDGDSQRFRDWKTAGVNRISIGVQSAHARDLGLFRRRHTFEESRATFEAARGAGFDNVSVDLIYGAPYQTLAEWKATLDGVLAWQPDHVSLYSLSLEEGTIMARQTRDGALPAPDPDLAADMHDCCRERLHRAGYAHYEISNWAKPGRECLHNLQYWLNEPFWGFGAGAHGYACGRRYWNVNPIPQYIARLREPPADAFPSPVVDGSEPVDRAAEMSDTVIMGLRLLERGVNEQEFQERFGLSLGEAFGETIAQLEALGLATQDTAALRLTPRAALVSNQVFWRFLDDN